MKEQSQIEEMRAAVRGDIERARRRAPDGALAIALRPEPVVAAEPEPDPQPEAEAAHPGPGGRIAAFFRRR